METWYGEIKQMKDVKVWYWLGEPNFGDMLNANICKDLFNINAIPVAPKECQASFIGSVFFWCIRKVTKSEPRKIL